MALPPDAVAQVERYCESRVSDDMRVEHAVRGSTITIVERLRGQQTVAGGCTTTPRRPATSRRCSRRSTTT
jgi:hypothetical protein